MSIQTIGAAVAGTAVVGGGGALAAYAAGAFESYGDLYEWMVKKNKWNDYKGKDIIAIKKKIKESEGVSQENSYKKSLSENWDLIKADGNTDDTLKSEIDKAGKQDQDSNYEKLNQIVNVVNVWCEKKLRSEIKLPRNENRDFDETKLATPNDDSVAKTWKAFNEICIFAIN
ncbi:hypothetical protein [Candidatus Mycoplasma haematohominis]|uniref:Uncharacterized protein n=1 Tax=Candidatus Mycoplasma haematohominis TaxID=1494318 RepID=A0A478FRN3_9MOLU|nr:hypothetical protein [Candidatus Mycoplasma haemohominis]GCE63724.1 hypothetical protein MHSWG343_07240 [Candidatus Mycoplasma haemohominis]